VSNDTTHDAPIMASETAASGASSNDAAARVPRLAGASGTGVAYAQWRQQMQTFLMRQDIRAADYTREIAQWGELVARVEASERESEHDAIALLLGTTQPKAKATCLGVLLASRSPR